MLIFHFRHSKLMVGWCYSVFFFWVGEIIILNNETRGKLYF